MYAPSDPCTAAPWAHRAEGPLRPTCEQIGATNSLYINQLAGGSATFVKSTSNMAAITDEADSRCAIFADYDNDVSVPPGTHNVKHAPNAVQPPALLAAVVTTALCPCGPR